MNDQPIRLKVLLQARHLQTHGAFCREYDRVASTIDSRLVGSPPSKSQFHRWLSGDVKGMPYTDHCRVLEAMFPGWTAGQLFLPGPIDQPDARVAANDRQPQLDVLGMQGFADVTAVFATRSEFTAKVPPHSLFDGASELRLAGLSLNVLCQQYPDDRLRQLVAGGATVRCLFLDPDGDAIADREREEGYKPGTLVSLNKLNMQILIDRVRQRLSEEAQQRLVIATYDEVIRFNLILVDQAIAAVQPYLYGTRGVESPTRMIRNTGQPGLYPIFEQMFTWLWDRSTPV